MGRPSTRRIGSPTTAERVPRLLEISFLRITTAAAALAAVATPAAADPATLVAVATTIGAAAASTITPPLVAPAFGALAVASTTARPSLPDITIFGIGRRLIVEPTLDAKTRFLARMVRVYGRLGEKAVQGLRRAPSERDAALLRSLLPLGPGDYTAALACHGERLEGFAAEGRRALVR